MVVALLGLAGCSENHGHDHAHDHAPTASESNASQTVAPQVQDGIAVTDAWVRATVGEQDATGAYFTVRSEQPVTLVGVASPAAEVVEVHEMTMEGDIMRMRKADRLAVDPGQALVLKPGGYHVMLMALTAPVETGQEVELSLQFEKPDGSILEMPVKAVAAPTASTSGGQPHHH
ncbi:MAG TPA: copper chaperone PCu(A)C [Limnobacter sp.]|nr:copper chaperone PCu(A)C [Limnobacter sp.]